MKLTQSNRRTSAMTRTEVIVVVVVLVILIIVLLATSVRSGKGGQTFSCVRNLKQIGIAFKIWEGDNVGKNPMEVSVREGGAKELAETGNVAAVFQVMSNAINDPRILICPLDKKARLAGNWTTEFGNQNISYFVSLGASNSYPQLIVTGDANLAAKGMPVKSGVLEWTAATPPTFTGERHQLKGYVGLIDGSVMLITNFIPMMASTNQDSSVSGFTNRFRIAIP